MSDAIDEWKSFSAKSTPPAGTGHAHFHWRRSGGGGPPEGPQGRSCAAVASALGQGHGPRKAQLQTCCCCSSPL
eukprot:3523158-Pyramimonas_sp.AAC.1